jgi:endoglycosylceramidase
MTDPAGRVVILHGVQVDKWEATAPVNVVDLSPDNVRFIAHAGFDLVRLSMTYSGVAPAPGVFDQAYVDQFVSFDRELAQHGIYDLLDMMQGEYSELVGGWGFPDWMTLAGGAPNTKTPFPNGYEENPAEYTAWDNFWHDAAGPGGGGIQDDYVTGLGRIAASFASAPGLLALEILNEPWPGSQWPTCANPVGCPLFDQLLLTPFYRAALSAIRKADHSHLVAYEPNIFFDYGAASAAGPTGDADALFAFHDYCLDAVAAGAAGFPNGRTFPDPLGLCGIDEQVVMANAMVQAARTGDALLMDEWGNTEDTSVITRLAAEADKAMIGWSYWAYEDCCGSLGAVVKDGTASPTAPGNLNVPVLDALVRPYPQAVAGTPTGWSYSPGTGNFSLSYTTARVAGGSFGAGARTRVELPLLDYPQGYRVTVHGARVVSASGASHLLLAQLPGARSVTVEVTRR